MCSRFFYFVTMSGVTVLISTALLLCLFIQCAQNSCLVDAESTSASDESSSISETSVASIDSGDTEPCQPDEVLSECIQNDCRIQSCSQRGLSILCAEPVPRDQCTSGCVCPVGTLRNDEYICVPEDECPEQEFSVIACPENEIISDCYQNVCGQYCSTKGYDLPCAPIAEEYCQRGCVCQSGYLRTAEGNCISEERCFGDLVCDENEIANSCPGICDDFCPTSDLPRDRNCFGTQQDSTACGEPRCTCRFNYRRDNNNGTCIPTRECPPFDCSSGPNQVYNPCPPLCPTDDCSQATPDGRCPIFGRIGIVVQCEPTCRCAPGYWTLNGICVPYLACPGKCPPNEEFSSCSNALCRAQDCTQRNGPIACPLVTQCEESCVCVEGTLRNENGECVPENECPALICGDNEQVNECTNGCYSDICPTVEELERRRNCVAPAVCGPPQCQCIPGYGRDESGNCILLEDCPPICPPGEEFSNCTQTVCRPQYCPQFQGSNSCFNSAAQENCFLGCVCVKGRVRGADGQCIPEDQCDEEICGDNEQLQTCTNRCDSDICPTVEELERRRNCIAPAVCGPPRCMCAPGYGRDGSGNCIPLESCPPICPPNEEYSTCSNALCRAQSCSQLGLAIACPEVAECEESCVCVEGALRNENGECVPESECLAPTCGQNEQLNLCTNGCDSDICPTVEEIARLRDCIAPAVCGPPRCDCIPGYARDDSGNCIPIEDCPPVCPAEEELSYCVESVCRPQNCSDLNDCRFCRPYPNEDCSIGCVCAEGLVRGNDGRCIPEDQCGSELTCGPNEEVSCVKECPPETTCRTRGVFYRCRDTDEKCQQKCVCKENFYRNYLGECISNDQCDQCSKDNEFFSCGQECDNECGIDYQNRTNCPIINIVCNPSCYCEDGFSRDSQGNCVPNDQCPPKGELTCGPNEEVACVKDCPPEITCRTRGILFNCLQTDEKCQSKCVCKKDFYRNYLGECISNDQCDQCSKDNEFFSCGQECDNECSIDYQNRTNCPIVNIVCNPKCYCEDGFSRDYEGNCIPNCECPIKEECGLNEEYGCVRTCPPETCLSLVARFKCDSKECEICNLGCKCKDGFLRQDDKSPCLPICQCKEMQNSPDCAKH